jgi:hypothetical protein
MAPGQRGKAHGHVGIGGRRRIGFEHFDQRLEAEQLGRIIGGQAVGRLPIPRAR